MESAENGVRRHALTATDYFIACEAGDGAALYKACTPDAKLYDSEGNLFMDLSAMKDAEACAVALKKLMGPTRLQYSERKLQIEDADAIVETHTVTVTDKESSSDEPVAVVRVRVRLLFDKSAKVCKAEETVVGPDEGGPCGPG
jgi:hypothetical protein